jgi:hypothetical protein
MPARCAESRLYLCSWDGNTGVTIYDGINWGWYIEQYMYPFRRDGGRPRFDESEVRLCGMYPFLFVGSWGRRRSTRRRPGAYRGPLAALLICLIAVAFPVWAQTQKNSKGGGSRICRLALKLDQTTYQEKGKKPINAELKFTNRLIDQPITIWDSAFWPNHKVLIQDEERDVDVPLTEMGKRYLKMFTPKGGPRDHNAPIAIPPGGSFPETVPVDLKLLYQLKPGKYRVQVLYEDVQPPTPMRLYSNPVAFTIE